MYLPFLRKVKLYTSCAIDFVLSTIHLLKLPLTINNQDTIITLAHNTDSTQHIPAFSALLLQNK